jgi:hypothetical protein
MDGQEEWDGVTERRKKHYCVQEVVIVNIQNMVANIEKCIKQNGEILSKGLVTLNEKQVEILTLLFGKDMKGGLITKVQLQEKKIETQERAIKKLWTLNVSVGLLLAGGIVKVWFL